MAEGSKGWTSALHGHCFLVWLGILAAVIALGFLVFFVVFSSDHRGGYDVHYVHGDGGLGCSAPALVHRPDGGSWLRTPYRRMCPAGPESHGNSSDYRPYARTISNVLMAYPGGDDMQRRGSEAQTGSTCAIMPNARGMTALVWLWGQFVDHDIALTEHGPGTGSLYENVTCDSVADSACAGMYIHMQRSEYVNDTYGARQQVNRITAWLDGSVVYGDTGARSNALRSWKHGMLAVSKHEYVGDLMPYNTAGMANAGGSGNSELYLGGDVRANEQYSLSAMHTLWLREHNWWARELAEQHPHWTDDELYWNARAIVTAELQSITYNEFLPALLGPYAVPSTSSHKRADTRLHMPAPKYDAALAHAPVVNLWNEFAAAGYRFGHSMVSDSLHLLHSRAHHAHASWTGKAAHSQCLPLHDAFFKPSLLAHYGLEPVLAGLAHQPAEEVDVHVVDSLRNFLHFATFIDLASLNILRGRDHALPYYHDVVYKLRGVSVQSWADITSDANVVHKLHNLYGPQGWLYLDLIVGILAEDHVSGGSLGATGTALLNAQFAYMRDSDAYFYKWNRGLCPKIRKHVHSTTLKDVILRNTAISEDDLPHGPSVFLLEHSY